MAMTPSQQRRAARAGHVACDAARARAPAARQVRRARAPLAGRPAVSARPFASILDTLTRQRWVTAALVVSERDGIVVESNLQIGQSGDRVAALAASLYRKARQSARGRRGWAPSRSCSSRRRAGGCAPSAAGDLVLVVVAEPAVNVGPRAGRAAPGRRRAARRGRRGRGGLMQMTVVETWIEEPLQAVRRRCGRRARAPAPSERAGARAARLCARGGRDVRVRPGRGDPRVSRASSAGCSMDDPSAGCTTADVLVRYF